MSDVPPRTASRQPEVTCLLASGPAGWLLAGTHRSSAQAGPLQGTVLVGTCFRAGWLQSEAVSVLSPSEGSAFWETGGEKQQGCGKGWRLLP